MTRSIVRDLNSCINCASCLKACKKRHGLSRMTMEGETIGCLSYPKICRQCAHPECVQACRLGAMVKDGDIVHIIPEKCVGCGLCAKACPYDAITMMEADKLDKKRFWQRRKEKATTNKRKTLRPMKCDQCYGYRSPACIAACPTRSLRISTSVEE